ncbi:flagellar export protein FliJ [Clostridiaceae bacterium 35-E11]
MLKFNFKYQNLLNMKEKYEDLIKGKLSEAQIRLENERQHLQSLESSKENYQRMTRSKATEGITIAFLQNCDFFLTNLNKRIDNQQGVIQQCNKEINQCRIALQKAIQEKKKFEKLRETEKEKFYFMEKKAEENFVDQLVTFKNFNKN